MYVCGEWEHGQLGLPLDHSFHDPTSLDPPRTPYQAPVPSTGVRINDKGEELHPIAAIDADELVSRPGAAHVLPCFVRCVFICSPFKNPHFSNIFFYRSDRTSAAGPPGGDNCGRR